MTDNRRDELLVAIAELGRQYPNWRLGQLIANVAGWTDRDLWDVEDQQLLAAAESHLRQSAASDDVRA
jgi:hypothetical protein